MNWKSYRTASGSERDKRASQISRDKFVEHGGTLVKMVEPWIRSLPLAVL